MTDKLKKTRTPKNEDSIIAGALKLSLEGKVKLCKLLKEDIAKTVQLANDAANTAKELLNGL